MIAVACGMADENNKDNSIGKAYSRYANFCQAMGVKPMPEYEWINKIVVGNQFSFQP